MTLSQTSTAPHQYIRPSGNIPTVQSFDGLQRSSNSWLSMATASNGNGGGAPSGLARIGGALSRRTSLQPSRSTPNTSYTRPRTSLQEVIRGNYNLDPSGLGGYQKRLYQKGNNTQVERRPRQVRDDIYCARLSVAAREFRQRMNLSDRVKNGIEYKNAFDGQEAVDTLMEITGTRQRDLAHKLGIALSDHRIFHDVNFESRLIDSVGEIYQYYDVHDIYAVDGSDSSIIVSAACSIDSEPRSASPQEEPQQEKQIPHGIFTPLTHCYSPTWDEAAHLLAFEKWLRPRSTGPDNRPTDSITDGCTDPEGDPSWTNDIARKLKIEVLPQERKRQEAIFELIHTEGGFVADMQYLEEACFYLMIDIIPAARREVFIEKVFCNIMAIRQVNERFLCDLRERQMENPVVSQIGDVILAFVENLTPFLNYCKHRHEGKYILQTEIRMNQEFKQFAKETERHHSALRRELAVYLHSPISRLGLYTLLFDAILKYTPDDNPDITDIPEATTRLKTFLTRVNEENGKARNMFDLERIEEKIVFKCPKVNLDLLNENRVLVKHGNFSKGPALNSLNYKVLLFDHYLVIAKVKSANNQEYYVVKQRPIPIELLQVTIPNIAQRTNSILSPLSPSGLVERRESSSLGARHVGSLGSSAKLSYPITFQHIGQRNSTPITLYAAAMPILKLWDQEIKKQQEVKAKRPPVFCIVSAVQECDFIAEARVNHITTFDNGLQYVLATDNGVYMGYVGPSSKPRKILSIPRVTQIQVLEEAQILLVLAERRLYEYQLNIVDGRPGNEVHGHEIESNVPFFHVGTSLGKQLVCVPQLRTLKTDIKLLEPSRIRQDRGRGLFGLFMRHTHKTELQKFKEAYIPGEAYAIELTASKMLITCPRGIMLVDVDTSKTQPMLNPKDKNLSFITEREKDESRLNIRGPVKHIAAFRMPHGDYLVCYDDNKGNRIHPNFRIEFEGAPEAYAYLHPYVIAFEPNFIEIRNVSSGELEQIIRGRNIRHLNTGYKADKSFIFGVMDTPTQASVQYIFRLMPIAS
ncbi:CNH domain-containing protein [Dichotomocladium elegans]|nr:CNH domain-containing protein [Dichotomocladium elegans]